jgi:hypothetical protein
MEISKHALKRIALLLGDYYAKKEYTYIKECILYIPAKLTPLPGC